MQTLSEQIIDQVSVIVLGKRTQIKLALACILARGHLLIEDLPGVGKTTLAHTFAAVLGLEFQRIQFTSDLLPADILGISVYNRATGSFEFHPGPIFTNVVLADEINRATPKAQSALLEAMEERQVTIEGTTRALNHPFFVIATQNPLQQIGTFALPESQLDRFLMRIEIGYPDAQAERDLLTSSDRWESLKQMSPAVNHAQLIELQLAVEKMYASDALIDYIQALLAYTRQPGRYQVGLSPRAGLSLLRCAKAWSFIANRKEVLPEDIQAIFPSVVGHRLHPLDPMQESTDQDQLARNIMAAVSIP